MCPFKKAFPFVLLLHLLVVVGIAGAFARTHEESVHIFTLIPVQGQGEVLKEGETTAKHCPFRPQQIKKNLQKLTEYIKENSRPMAVAVDFPEPEAVANKVLPQLEQGSVAAATNEAKAKVGGAVDQPKSAAKLVPPVALYQPKPRHYGASGEVCVLFTITEEGRVEDVQLEQGDDPALVRAARNAISQWRFSPAKENGQPVSLRVRQVVEF